MEHIKDGIKKYSNLGSEANELKIIKQKIIKLTGIEPDSIGIKNKSLNIKAKNNYEAVELRMKKEYLIKQLNMDIKIN